MLFLYFSFNFMITFMLRPACRQTGTFYTINWLSGIDFFKEICYIMNNEFYAQLEPKREEVSSKEQSQALGERFV